MGLSVCPNSEAIPVRGPTIREEEGVASTDDEIDNRFCSACASSYAKHLVEHCCPLVSVWGYAIQQSIDCW